MADLVRDHIPLEQGLRQARPAPAESVQARVRDHIPLEQGLRRQADRHLGLRGQMSETIFH